MPTEIQLNKESLTLLILDDDLWIRGELEEFFNQKPEFNVYTAALPSEAMSLIEQHKPNIFILDIKLPEMDGLTLLETVKPLYPEMEIIMITGHGDLESAVKAMRSGASDYLTKPFRLHEIDLAIQRTGKLLSLAQQIRQMQGAKEILNREMEKHLGTPMISESPAMKDLVALMQKVAKSSDTPVLITGESGAGKELVARGIHYLSPRKKGLFCAVNTSTITENSFESEFFGHKRGAVAHAVNDRQGWFETAHNGTLFLDEISEMPINSQVKLLRVLEDRRIIRVGAQESIPIDVRVICATNRDIDNRIKNKRFRKDLYYRLNTFVIEVPPLRERREDIPLLVNHYVQMFSDKFQKPLPKISPDVLSVLDQYRFPGNVRELKNMVERALILCEGSTLTIQHFPGMIKANVFSSQSLAVNGHQPPGSADQDTDSGPESVLLSSAPDLDAELIRIEKNFILSALERHRQNRSKAAKALNISRQSLYRRLKKLKIE